MSIISIQRDTNNNVSLVRMEVSDTIATVGSTDYILNNQEAINLLNGGVWGWFITDMVLVAASNGNAFFYFPNTSFATLMIYGEQGSGTINPGLNNEVAIYDGNGTNISGLPITNNGVLAYDNAGNPSITTVLPNAVQANITTVGTIGTGVWQGTDVAVGFGGTGKSTFTAYSVICAGTTATGAFQNVSGLGTSGQLLTSNGAGALPTWQTNAASGTVNNGTQNDLAYYATTGTAVSPITTAASSVLTTTGLGVPTWVSQLPLNIGGTNASLTASNGGIVYSTASALAILAATATAGQLLMSGSSAAPTWSTATFASTYSAFSILYASAANTVAGLANGTTGQVLLATTSAAPSWGSVPAAPYSNVVVSAGNSGAFTTSSTTFVTVTNLTLSITTKGGPVLLKLQSSSTSTSPGSGSYLAGVTNTGLVAFFRGSTQLSGDEVFSTATTLNAPGGYGVIDTPAAGTYTYTFQGLVNAGGTLTVMNCNLVAMEI